MSLLLLYRIEGSGGGGGGSMPAKTPASLKVETEGDLQVVLFTLSTVANGDTTDMSKFFKSIREISAFPSTSAGVGGSVSAGVITWAISTGTPDLIVRVAGH